MLEDNSYSYAYGNNIAVLNNNILTIYNKNAKKMSSIEVSISIPKFASSGNYLLLADENDDNIYLINNDILEWQKNIDGKVSQLAVNSKGAVAISLSETTYKSIIIMYDVIGNENFKNYLSSSTVTSLALSENSAYLSYIEINTNNVYVDSCVKTISVEKAKKDPANAVIYTYSLDDKTTLLLNIKYKKQKLVLYADDGIYILEKNNKTKLADISDKTSFATINLNGFLATINISNNTDNKENNNVNNENIINNETQTSEDNNEKYELTTINVLTNKKTTYLISETVKSIYSNENIIALNTGNNVEFIDTNGWLIKRFIQTQNFKNIIIGNNFAIIIYKDKIEIIKL